MSVKTAGHHVSAVLDKLDAPTRGQAAAAAHRLGLGPGRDREIAPSARRRHRTGSDHAGHGGRHRELPKGKR